ncbi:MAG: hypothetical protein RLZZ597_3788 [Cyanobacteriota bacterium]|jgi:hypothetical protein
MGLALGRWVRCSPLSTHLNLYLILCLEPK